MSSKVWIALCFVLAVGWAVTAFRPWGDEESPILDGSLLQETFLGGDDDEDAEERVKELVRLADAQHLDYLEFEAEYQLWPRRPEVLERMRSWIGRAREVLARRSLHQQSIDALRERGEFQGTRWTFSSTVDYWQHARELDIVERMDALTASPAGWLPRVEERIKVAEAIVLVTIEESRKGWSQAIDAIESNPAYGGLKIEPQVGLIPLGTDESSGLEEFWVWETGEAPQRDPNTGRFDIRDETAIVLVLLPGGTFSMGASREEGAIQRDPWATGDEGPIHEVTLDPFFMGKFEVTQGQWLRFFKKNRAYFTAESQWVDAERPLAHPAEEVNWHDSKRMMERMRLTLPTEAQWEYACRAGTHTIFSTGDDIESLRGSVNIADESAKTFKGIKIQIGFVDSFKAHSPVGSFLPNPFGIHDMHGNVWEWCRDTFGSYRRPVAPGDGLRLDDHEEKIVVRGGSFWFDAPMSRCSYRGIFEAEIEFNNFGFRAARPLD